MNSRRQTSDRLFPNLFEVGRYDHFSQCIALNFPRETFDRLGEEGETSKSTAQACSAMLHELTHWLQHTSTLWGQRMLAAWSNAISIRRRDTSEEYWRIAEYGRLRKEVKLPAYYSNVTDEGYGEWDRSPVRILPTIGYRFDCNGVLDSQSPIILARMFNQSGLELGRNVFSIESLLETCAIETQMQQEAMVLFTLGEARNREGLAEEFESNARAFLGMATNARYSLATHYLTYIYGLSSSVMAVSMTAALA